MEIVLGAFIKCCFSKSDEILNCDVCSACLKHLKDILAFLQ
jgi:hypothetical protein